MPLITNSSFWSKQLQVQTRDAIQELKISPDGNLHFKHSSNVFAYATLLDLLDDHIVLHLKDDPYEFKYSCIDELIDAGWVID